MFVRPLEKFNVERGKAQGMIEPGELRQLMFCQNKKVSHKTKNIFEKKKGVLPKKRDFALEKKVLLKKIVLPKKITQSKVKFYQQK